MKNIPTLTVPFILVTLAFSDSAFGQWMVRNAIDEIRREESQFFAYSPEARVVKGLKYPYSNYTTSRLIFRCDKEGEFAAMMFASTLPGAPHFPFIKGIYDGGKYRTKDVISRWDDEIIHLAVSQDSKISIGIQFDSNDVIDMILKSNRVVIEIDFGEFGVTQRTYSLKGSSSAIAQARASCAAAF